MAQFDADSFGYKKPAYMNISRLIHRFFASVTFSVLGVAAVVALFVYVFGFGDWKLAGRELVTYPQQLLDIAFFSAVLTVSIGETAQRLSLRSLHIQLFEPVKVELDEDPTVAKVFGAIRAKYLISAVCSFLFGGVVLFVVRDPLAGVLGWALSDILCILMMFIVPSFIGGLFSLPIERRAIPSDLTPEEQAGYRQIMWDSDSTVRHLVIG